jgi:MoxR-like ATPase
MALDRCARAYAWLNNRDYVVPEDIQLFAPDVLRHRIILSFAAEAEGMTADSCIAAILSRVAVP